MLDEWCRNGEHIRNEVGDDKVLMTALRILLPSYSGPGLTLYRGDNAWNRRKRTYGLSWSTERNTARDYARSCTGGSVLLCTEAPPDAIISAPAFLNNGHGDDEYLVDRRLLLRVTVLERFTEQPNTGPLMG
jgi:hypothetical protein